MLNEGKVQAACLFVYRYLTFNMNPEYFSDIDIKPFFIGRG